MANNKGRIFRIGGVSGCGKTTLTALVDKLVKESDAPFMVVNTGIIQCELAGVANEKAYREIPEAKRREFFSPIAQRILEIADQQPEKVWYFERHLCSMNDDGELIERGIPNEHGERMIGQAVILACERQIAMWRNLDKRIRQDRHLLTPAQIAVEQVKEVELALEAGRRWNFPVRLFINQQGNCHEVASEIFDFLKRTVE